MVIRWSILEPSTPDGQCKYVAGIHACHDNAAAFAAAGGINQDNAGTYVRAGADILVTSWPYPGTPNGRRRSIMPVPPDNQAFYSRP